MQHLNFHVGGSPISQTAFFLQQALQSCMRHPNHEDFWKRIMIACSTRWSMFSRWHDCVNAIGSQFNSVLPSRMQCSPVVSVWRLLDLHDQRTRDAVSGCGFTHTAASVHVRLKGSFHRLFPPCAQTNRPFQRTSPDVSPPRHAEAGRVDAGRVAQPQMRLGLRPSWPLSSACALSPKFQQKSKHQQPSALAMMRKILRGTNRMLACMKTRMARRELSRKQADVHHC